MTKSINLIFGCHSHQPVGNFESVIEAAYERAYLPFTEVLERYPAVRVTQHFTGPLLDWFEAHRPEFLDRLAALVAKGQVEIMGGGYYEQLICAVPERDSLAQIRRTAAFCKKRFGQIPKGMWLPERVWEPHMPHILNGAGIKYTALDDTHFLCSGLNPDDLFGYYVTEDEGRTVAVFPILKKLRYLIPFHQVHETIDYLREHATEDGLRCAVIHDDGEKFGVWPGTNRSVYTEGWLESLFEALTENQDWIHSVTYSQYMEKAPALGRTYLTAASYEEMMEWALPTPMQRNLHALVKQLESDPSRANERRFVRGGFWRSFLAKYEESNNIHKKMLRVSAKLAALPATNEPRRQEAERLLHEGQCNCAYWHGVFGGLYLNHLRTALYEKLIASERLLNALTHKDDDWVNCEVTDFDGDGRDEALLENVLLSLGFSARDGGTLFEWDYTRRPFNFANTLTRREEPYHDALRSGRVHVGDVEHGDLSIHELVRAKEEGLDQYLVYDPYRRVSLRDHFLAADVTAESLWTGRHDERGDFATASYEAATKARSVSLERSGSVRLDDGEACPLRIRKTISLEPRASAFKIRYDLRNQGQHPVSVLFGVEFAVNLLSGSSYDRYYWSEDRDLQQMKLGAMGCEESLKHLALRDEWMKLECGFRFSKPARVFHFAIETVSQSEAGQERVYQGSILIPTWQVTCPVGRSVVLDIVAEVCDTN